jgi:site-specific recombinase XerD
MRGGAGSQPAPATTPPSLEPYLGALTQLPPEDQQIVLNLIRSLAERNGLTVAHTIAPGLQTLEEGVPLWTASLKAERYSAKTIQCYVQDVRRYLGYDPNPTHFTIQSYLAQRLDEVSPARVAMERNGLRSFFKFMHSAGLAPADPTANIKSFKVTYGERELPSKEDIATLLRCQCYHHKATAKFRLMLCLLLDTGLRINEACSIRKANINFDRLEIKVMGKGRKERIVPISPFVGRLLEAWLQRDGQSEWLFPANTKTGYWGNTGFYKELRNACRKEGIRQLHPHQLRHFFATHNLRNGARLEVVSRILGHASIAVTADIYTHIDKEEIHETHRQFSPFARLMLPQG